LLVVRLRHYPERLLRRSDIFIDIGCEKSALAP
jgi:hypothetical protein